MTTDQLWTVPNVISLSRIVLAGGFVVFPDPWARVTIVAVAALSDLLDGLVARLYHRKSVFGALIDPICDRIFTVVAISAILFDGLLSPSQFLIFISRDIATAVGFIVAKIVPSLRAAIFRARLLGKAVTVLQLITLIAALVLRPLLPGLIVTIGILSALSIADYTYTLWRFRRSRILARE